MRLTGIKLMTWAAQQILRGLRWVRDQRAV